MSRRGRTRAGALGSGYLQATATGRLRAVAHVPMGAAPAGTVPLSVLIMPDGSIGWRKVDKTGALPSDVGAEPVLGSPVVDGHVLASLADGTRLWIPLPTLADLGGEPALGAPDVDGKLLASTAGGVRSWVAGATVPLAWGDVSKAGSSLADLATRSAADLSSGTLPDARLSARVPLKDVEETISAAAPWAFTAGLKERGRAAAMGEWTSVPYDADDFTVATGTWTVEPGDFTSFAYTLIGQTCVLVVVLNRTSISGGPSQLRVDLPAEITPAATVVGSLCRLYDNAVERAGIPFVQEGIARLLVTNPAGAFTDSVNNTTVQVTIIYPIGWE